jgi:hypothetical protein
MSVLSYRAAPSRNKIKEQNWWTLSRPSRPAIGRMFNFYIAHPTFMLVRFLTCPPEWRMCSTYTTEQNRVSRYLLFMLLSQLHVSKPRHETRCGGFPALQQTPCCSPPLGGSACFVSVNHLYLHKPPTYVSRFSYKLVWVPAEFYHINISPAGLDGGSALCHTAGASGPVGYRMIICWLS